MYYLARQRGYLAERDGALEVLSRAIRNGFSAIPQAVRDPWLDALRTQPQFTALLREAHALQQKASTALVAAGGDALLGIAGEE